MERKGLQGKRYVVWFLFALCIGLMIQLGSLYAKHDGIPLRMLRMGSGPAEIAGIPKMNEAGHRAVLEGDGFDGQFFYLLGLDPLLQGDTIWRTLDAPRLRARRIGLAWAGLALGLGKERLNIGLLLVQSLSLLILLAVLQYQAFQNGLRPFLCVAIPLLLPVLTPLEFVTSELLAGALVVAALAASAGGKYRACWLFVASACLCKEICALVAVAIVGQHLLEKRWRPAAVQSTALVPIILWMGYLHLRLPAVPDSGSSLQNVGWPLVGLWSSSAADVGSLFGGLQPLRVVGNLAARAWYAGLAGLAISLIVVRRPTPARILLVLSAFLALILSSGGRAMAYDFIYNFSRQLFLLPLAGLVVLFLESKSNSKWEMVVLQIWLWIGALVGVSWIAYQFLS